MSLTGRSLMTGLSKFKERVETVMERLDREHETRRAKWERGGDPYDQGYADGAGFAWELLDDIMKEEGHEN